MPCLSFVKTENGSSLEKKFSLPPSFQAVDPVKRKRRASSEAKIPYEGKSHNI